MAVEIVILSGARQGERLLLEAGEFRAGDDPACEVFFDPQSDPPAKNRCALFRLAEEGWFVERSGLGELFLNQEPVTGKTRIRSGDLVRMSERGPDFAFSIVTRATASSRSPAGAAPASRPSAPGASVSEKAAEPGPQSTPASQREPSLPQAPVPQPVFAPKPASGAAAEPWRHAFWAVVALAICILLLVAISLFTLGTPRRQGDPEIAAGQVAPPAGQTDSSTEQTDSSTGQTDPKTEKPGSETEQAGPEAGQAASPPEKRDEPAHEPADVWAEVCEPLREAVFLVEIEVGSEPRNHFLPFATCCAIGEDTLLVSAREACFLAKFREQEGYKVWVENPAKGIKEAVQDIRVHRDFAKVAPEESGDWIFVNLGLLTVQGKLPRTAPLASSEELSALNEGLSVACFGFTFEEVDKILDRFEPRLTPAKIYDPSLFQLKAKIPPNACGNAIVNARGKITGVYSAPAPEGTPVKDLHYATRVEPDSLKAWLEKRDTEIWVDPPIPKTSSSP